MSKIILTKRPKRGDAVLGNLLTNSIEFATHESMMEATLDTNLYEYTGPVLGRKGKDVFYAFKENASKKEVERCSFKLTGFTLDSTDRTGTLNIRTASNWSTAVAYQLSYNASTLADLASQLNTQFQDDTNFPYLKSQDWYAAVVGEEIHLHHTWENGNQYYNSGSDGFSLTWNLLPAWAALANILRRNGQTGGEGVISQWERALAYYRLDQGTASYQGGRTSDQGSNMKQTYPINLPTWLGTSTKNPGDFCAGLRAIFGEGEKGWIEFMKSCLPVYPSDWGNMGMRDGKAITDYLVSQKFISNTKATPQPMCPAADYCANIETAVLPKGTFSLPTVEELYEMLQGIKYSTINSREADLVNALQYKMGGSPINNGSSFWSCLRCNGGNAWGAYGDGGFFSTDGMCGSHVAVPVSHYRLA